MKRKPNYLKHILQWGVLAAIVGTIVWAALGDKPVDVEKYCPFGGLQAFGTFLVQNSLPCSMSMLQIMMGIVLAVGVILFSKLFCGYLCPLGTLGEAMGRAGKKLKIQVDVPSGSLADKLLRVIKYVLLFTILYFTLTSSELFCKRLDPYYALATGFQGEIVMWMSLSSIVLLLLGGFAVKMFWCRYICALGAISNIFKFTLLFVAAIIAAWVLGIFNVANAWVWVIGATCVAAYVIEIVKMRSCVFPLMSIKRDEQTCNGCKVCEKKCPYQVPIHEYVKVKHVDCTMCGQCISACSTNALQVNGRRSWRWVPGILAVVLFFFAIWAGSKYELPTIDEKWGEYEQVENLETYSLDGLQTIKCFGSAKAFSSKMQTLPGVHGVRVFVRRHGVEVTFDPTKTDTVKIQEKIFTPTLRKFATPDESTPMVDVVKLGVEGLHDRMDMIYFGMVMQKIEGVYGFTAEFNCPVDVVVYVDPAAGLTEDTFEDAIEADELVVKTKDGENTIPMHTVLKAYKVDEQISREAFAQLMFSEVEKLAGKFIANVEKWGDDTQFPKAVYEMPYPGIEKMIIRMSFPYFKSFLSCTDGIISVDFELREMVPILRLHYVKSMWTDERLWNEVFQAPKWTLRMADGTFKEEDPRLKFITQGQTVVE